MIPYQYTYLFADLFIILPVLIFFFLFRKDLRKKIIIIGLFGLILGPVMELWYKQDYWHPLYATRTAIGVEDLFFSFGLISIFSVMYEVIFAKHLSKIHKRKNHWILLLMPLILAFFYLFDLKFPQYYINSIYVSILAFLINTAVILTLRKDLLFDSICSSIIAGLFFLIGYSVLLYFFPELFNKLWLFQNISGITIFRIPLEELLWAFSLGLMCGPLYEFYAGLQFQISSKEIK